MLALLTIGVALALGSRAPRPVAAAASGATIE